MTNRPSMLVIVPTRERPDNATRLASAFADTNATAHLLFALDSDDPAVLDGSYQQALARRRQGDERVILQIGDPSPGGIVRPLNDAAGEFAYTYDVLGFMGDDHLPRTPRWDRVVLDAQQGLGGGVVYGNDLIHGEALPTAAFLDARIIRALGYMAPPQLTHLFVDNYWLALGRALGVRYLPDMVIEHLHPLVGKAPQDEGYDRVNQLYGPDGDAWQAYERDQLPDAISRARQALDKEGSDQ